MGKILAIKGHPTRGKEVIELLEMLGGHTDEFIDNGIDEKYAYFIVKDQNNVIDAFQIDKKDEFDFDAQIFTLEEFLEKFPFKVGDFVRIPEYESEVRICKMKWTSFSDIDYLVYRNDDEEWYTAYELLEYNDNPNKMRDCKKCGLHFGSVRCFDKDCPHNKPKSYAVGLKDGKVIECGVNKEIVMNENKPLFKPGDDIKLNDSKCKRTHEDVIFDSIIWHLRNSVNNGKQHLSGGECEAYFREVVKKNNENKMKNVLAELLEHIKTTPKEDLEREFEEIKEWSNVGPTIEEFRTFCECVNKKPKYLTTYKECCEVLGIEEDLWFVYEDIDANHINPACISNYRMRRLDLYHNLEKLLICRDAYWKIAGEQMGLGKPWEPDWTSGKPFYCISVNGNIIRKGRWYTDNKILAFPTEELRDTFYENFNDLIEECKELL